MYRARDSRLSRDVAIKVLPAELASDPSRLQSVREGSASRFGAESPQHRDDPRHRVDGDVWYIAMELVEGETLRKLLVGGAFSIRKLLQIAPQVGEGLAKAHEAGIVHRDLKPENVMVTRDGVVKILDFGVAKLTPIRSGSDESSHPLTETATRPGTVLGTVGYMSPEQASSEAVDFRSDQFSLGSILYEMATGKRAFHGKTGVDTLSAILNEEPEPIAALNPQAPAPLRWIVERCLAKDPNDRYGTTRDLARDLGAIRDHLSEAAVTGSSVPRDRRRRRRVLASAALAAAMAVLLAGVQASRQLAKTTPPSFKRLTFRRGNVAMARFAGDGQTIVYGATWNGEPWRVFSTRLDGPETAPIPAPDAFFQAISRSGELAITLVTSTRPWTMASSGTLARAPLSGGAPREVLDGVQFADWAADGSSLLVVRNVEGKTRLEYPIGRLLYETPGEIRAPRVSPRGDLAAFLDNPVAGDDGGSIAVVDREGKKRTLASGFTSMSGLAWARGGREVWFTASREGIASSLYAVSLSGSERMLLRTPAPIAILDVAADGSVLIREHTSSMQIAGLAPGEDGERDLSWLDYSFVCDISADGKSFTFDESAAGVGGNYRLYLGRTDGSSPIRLFDGGCGPLSHDGLLVLSRANVAPNQFVLVPTKSGQPTPLPSGGLNLRGALFFRDGKRLLWGARSPGRACASMSRTQSAVGLDRLPPRGSFLSEPRSPFPRMAGGSSPTARREGRLSIRSRSEKRGFFREPFRTIGRFSGRRTAAVYTSWKGTEPRSVSHVSTWPRDAGTCGKRSCRLILPAFGVSRASSSPTTPGPMSTPISEHSLRFTSSAD